MKIEEKFVETKWGRVHYLETGKGKRTLIIFHGFASYPLMILCLSPVLKNYRLIAPYLPGYGKSFIPPKDFSFKDEVKVMMEFIDRLCPGKVSLYGGSFGGTLALNVACQLKGKVEKLVMHAPALEPLKDRRLMVSILGLLADQVLDRFRGKFLQRNWFLGKKEVVFTKPSLVNLGRTQMGLLNEIERPDCHLAKSEVLFLWGKFDHALDCRNYSGYLKQTGEVYLFNGGHCIHLSQPTGFLEKVADFLQK